MLYSGMYTKKLNTVLAFHGCDAGIRDAVVNGAELKPSTNSYDWLGNGIYFWESDPVRAFEWAVQAKERKDSSVMEPAVLGAVLDLGHCLDLTERSSVPILKLGHKWLEKACLKEGREMPKNKNIKNNADLLLRDLDCAVIQKIHEITKQHSDKIAPFDSVRGLFLEGNEVYNGSGFREKTHIQICIINPNCIKGYFLPRELDKAYPTP